jgi:hypothetical protein
MAGSSPAMTEQERFIRVSFRFIIIGLALPVITGHRPGEQSPRMTRQMAAKT